MRKKNFVVVFAVAVVMITAATLLESCQSPTAVSNSMKTTIQVDTVSYKQIGGQSVTSSLYLNIEKKWGLAKDTARADSLANWFARSQFKIEDMWFPASLPICLRPFITFNYIFVSLAQPDTLIDTLGFKPWPTPDSCFPAWKHYKFIRTGGGT